MHAGRVVIASTSATTPRPVGPENVVFAKWGGPEGLTFSAFAATFGAPFNGRVAEITPSETVDDPSQLAATIHWGDGAVDLGAVTVGCVHQVAAMVTAMGYDTVTGRDDRERSRRRTLPGTIIRDRQSCAGLPPRLTGRVRRSRFHLLPNHNYCNRTIFCQPF